MASLVVIFPTLALFLAGVFLIVLGSRTVTRLREAAQQRVEVGASVVELADSVKPRKVTFEYQLPDGTWRTETKTATGVDLAHEATTPTDSGDIGTGSKFPVFINPYDPTDVELSRSPHKNVNAVIWIGLGSLIALGAAAFMITMFTLG